MILIYEGPFIWLLVAMIIVYIAYRKNKNNNKKLQNEMDEISAKYKEIGQIDQAYFNNIKTLNKSDFKHLKDDDFKNYSYIYGIKFI